MATRKTRPKHRPKKPKRPKKPLRPVKLPSTIRKLKFLRYVRNWIDGHPAIANAIAWEDANGVSRAFPSWSRWEQDKLRDTVANMRMGDL